MENAQPTPGQTAGQLPRLDGVRFLGCEYEDSQRCGGHGYILDHAVSRNGRQTFRRSYLAIIRPENTTLESLLDRKQHGKDRSSRRWFVRSKRLRPFFWQRYAQWQTHPGRLPLGCTEQRTPCMGSGLFTG